MDWSWAVGGVTNEVPRTTGPECVNYMTNRRRWTEAILFTLLFLYVMHWAVKRLDPIVVPPPKEVNKPHSAIRLLLLISMTFIFGLEMGFKLANQSVIFAMNPCHIQTLVQIYILASKPSKTTIALFRIQMNNLNGPFLAFMFPEVECRTLPFEQATYWIQHALLYLIPVYILRSGAYKIEDISDYNWVIIGVMIMLIYHFVVLNAFSILTGINLNHMLCAAVADPFQGQNYRIAAVIHESILCPILNKVTVLIFNTSDTRSKIPKAPLELRISNRADETSGDRPQHSTPYHQQQLSSLLTPSPLSLSSSSAISEISLAAEMAAAVAGVGPVGVIRRLKHSTVTSVGANITERFPSDTDDTDAEAVTPSDTISGGFDDELLLEQEAEMSSHITADYSMPTTKID